MICPRSFLSNSLFCSFALKCCDSAAAQRFNLIFHHYHSRKVFCSLCVSALNTLRACYFRIDYIYIYINPFRRVFWSWNQWTFSSFDKNGCEKKTKTKNNHSSVVARVNNQTFTTHTAEVYFPLIPIASWITIFNLPKTLVLFNNFGAMRDFVFVS